MQARKKGRIVAKHGIFPMICGSQGSKSRLARAAGAEPSGEMRDEQLHAVVARSTFRIKSVKNWGSQTTFGSWDVEKVHAVVARSIFRSQKCKKLTGSEHFWTFRCRSAWQPQGIVHQGAKRQGFVAFPKTMADVGHLKRICKDAFRVAGAVQEICSSELLGGQGIDVLRGVAFWSIRPSGLLRWFYVTGVALFHGRRYFRQMEWKNRRTHWYEVVSSALNRLVSFLQNSFVFNLAANYTTLR